VAKSSGSRRKAKSVKAEKHADSRVQLIDAALEIILRDGADALRIEDVCEHVGVTKGSLYWHFRDRNGLIRESLLEHMRRLGAAQLDALSDAIGNFSTRDEYLGQLGGAIVDPYDTKEVEARWQRLELMANSRRDTSLSEIMSDIQRRHHRYLTDLMEMASARGILRRDVDPKALAAMLTSVGLGSNVMSMLGDDAPSQEAWSSLIFVLIDTLFPKG